MRKSCSIMMSVLRVLIFFAIALSSFVACAPENEKVFQHTFGNGRDQGVGARPELTEERPAILAVENERLFPVRAGIRQMNDR